MSNNVKIHIAQSHQFLYKMRFFFAVGELFISSFEICEEAKVVVR